MGQKTWDKFHEDEKELKKVIEHHLIQYFKIDPAKIEPDIVTVCKYHLKQKEFKKGTVILVVSGSSCPYCDVATLGIYSKE